MQFGFDIFEMISGNAFTIVLIVVIIFLVGLVYKTLLGKTGKKTFKSISKGRTISEKIVYFAATVGILSISAVVVVIAALLEINGLSIDYVVENIYLVGIGLFIVAFLFVNCLIFFHKRGTPLMKNFPQPMLDYRKEKKKWRR